MTSRERILESAIELFAEKGKRSTHIENIAAEANINKAMVYYYYINKDHLHEEVLEIAVRSIYQNIYDAFEKVSKKEKDMIKNIHYFITAHYQAFTTQETYAKIIFDALANEPEQVRLSFQKIMMNWEINFPQEILRFFQLGVAKRIFRKINYKHVLISMIGMNLIYFIYKPIAQSILKMEINDENAFLQERKENNIDLLLNGILIK